MASRTRWLLYAPYGFTGRLLAEEALRRGHRPILAGRDRAKLQRVVAELEAGLNPVASTGEEARGSLPHRVLSLKDPEALRAGLEGVSVVLHAAGPFVETAQPMMEACLDMGVHYLDITGEVPVFEAAFALDARARKRGVVLMPGVGMDVIPTDAVAALLARSLPSATRLELALHSPGRPSAGTIQTVLEGIPGGLWVRRGGRLVRANPGRREFRRWVELGPEPGSGPMAGRLGGRRSVAPYTWGDLATAWRTTGIGDITCYMSTPRWQVRLMPVALPMVRSILAIGPLRRYLRRRVARRPKGSGPRQRHDGRTRVWGRVEDDEGRCAEMVLEFPEAYRFTAMGGIRALEEVLAREDGGGTLTPAGAFGADWVLDLPEVAVIRA